MGVRGGAGAGAGGSGWPLTHLSPDCVAVNRSVWSAAKHAAAGAAGFPGGTGAMMAYAWLDGTGTP